MAINNVTYISVIDVTKQIIFTVNKKQRDENIPPLKKLLTRLIGGKHFFNPLKKYGLHFNYI